MRRAVPLVAAVWIFASASAAHAFPRLIPRSIQRPEVAIELGRSFLVESPVDGTFDQGGFSSALAVLWPVDDRMRFGVSLFADDAGTKSIELVDPSQSPPVALGRFDLQHLNLYGAAWRLEASGPRVRGLETFARGEWGVYQLHVDALGSFVTAETTPGFALGGGAMAHVKEGHAVALAVSFHRVWIDSTRDYMSAALAWRWRPVAGRDAPPPPKR